MYKAAGELCGDNRLDLAVLNPRDIKGLLGPAVSIALLGMIESLLCGASAGKMANVRLNSDQELVAQGIGNIILPFFGGIPATAAIARTSVALKSGARTRLTGIFHALGLLVFMFILGPVMAKIPLSALAGVLMVTAFRMNDWKEIRYIFSYHFKGAAAKYLITMAAAIVFDLTMAILLGVVTGLVLLVSRLSHIEINYEKVDMSLIKCRDLIRFCCLCEGGGPIWISQAPLPFCRCWKKERPLREGGWNATGMPAGGAGSPG